MTQPAEEGMTPSHEVATTIDDEASQVTAGDLRFGGKLSELMAIRGLSERQVARRASCSAGRIAKLASASERPTRQIAARLDDVLGADGELAGLADAATHIGHALGIPGGSVRALGSGLSLSLPYVPGRLVIEISGSVGSEEWLPTA
jgi:transcriptional regulator with XRE-family HTH domain